MHLRYETFLKARLTFLRLQSLLLHFRRHLSDVPGLNTGRGSKPSSTSTASKGNVARGGASSKPSFSTDSSQCTLAGTVAKGNRSSASLPLVPFPMANPFLILVLCTRHSYEQPAPVSPAPRASPQRCTLAMMTRARWCSSACRSLKDRPPSAVTCTLTGTLRYVVVPSALWRRIGV